MLVEQVRLWRNYQRTASKRGWFGVPALLALALLATPAIAARPAESGQVAFEPGSNEGALAEMFRLPSHTFDYQQQFVDTVSTSMEISLVTFPSPIETPHKNNNTVHCEYFRPLKPGRHPAVVVLHILGGDFELSRLFARCLADHGIAALFLKMPYYGPRRQPGESARMVSADVTQTVAGMKQAVLDIRHAAAWLATREEIDAQQLGIFGISLGGITGALAATAEPRFHKVCLMLAGGDVAQVAWSNKELEPLKNRWLAAGGTKETFFQQLKTVDPVTYADRISAGRKVLMINASHDELIPRACTESLWQAFGRQDIVWLEAGHYSAMRFILDGLTRVTKFFQPSS